MEPQVDVTQNMEVIAYSLLGLDPAVMSWEKPFEPPPASAESKAALTKLNALMQDLVDATNHGRAYDLQRLAARHGVPMEQARQAEDILRRQDREMAVDVPGGLPAVTPVPPSGRMKMRARLAECDLFRFNPGVEAQRLFGEVAEQVQRMRPPPRASRVRTMLTLGTLPTVLEDVDDPPWADPDHTVLKYSLYLLCRAGRDYHSTADYAAEILRLFWHVLVESKERAALRLFMRQYAIWCREVLVKAGLAEEDVPGSHGAAAAVPARPGAAFMMRATPFFNAWVSVGRIS